MANLPLLGADLDEKLRLAKSTQEKIRFTTQQIYRVVCEPEEYREEMVKNLLMVLYVNGKQAGREEVRNDELQPLSVVDPDTGLEWEAAGSVKEIIWFDTDNYCDQLNQKNFAGHSDWRIPTRVELYTLVVDAEHDPCIKPLPGIECKSSNYWSSTTYAVGTSGAWNVNFSNGGVYVGSKSNSYHVRCVRGGRG